MPRLRFVDRNWRLAAALGNGSEIAELRVVFNPLSTEVHVVCRRSRPDDVPDVAVLKPVGLDKGLKFRLTTSDRERVDARGSWTGRRYAAGRDLSAGPGDDRGHGCRRWSPSHGFGGGRPNGYDRPISVSLTVSCRNTTL